MTDVRIGSVAILPLAAALATSASGAAASPGWNRDIAPVLAYHCNRCHGDDGIAGGLDTTSHAALFRGGNLGPAIVAGRPDDSPLVQFLEGRRGESRRMPAEAPALDAAVIARVRLWIEQGARDDVPAAPVRIERCEIPRKPRFEIACRVPAKSYVIVRILGPGRGELHRTAAVVTSEHRWTLRSGAGWPARLTVEAELRHSDEPSGPFTLSCHP